MYSWKLQVKNSEIRSNKMFGRVLIAQLKLSLRSKIYVFWTLAFPILLGTLFYFAFSSIYDSNKNESIPIVIEADEEAMDEYKVMQAFSYLDKDRLRNDLEKYAEDKAVAEAMGKDFTEEFPLNEETLDKLEEVKSFEDMKDYDINLFPYEYMTKDKSVIDNISIKDHPFVEVLNNLEYDDGTKMVEEVTVKDHAEAEKLLEDGDIAGIIKVSSMKDIYLEVNGMGVNHSILSSIISEYRVQVDKAINTINENPEDLERSDEIMDESTASINFVTEKSSGGENRDPFVTYFYNLIAMLAMMASIASLYTTVSNQANQSATGLRLDSSPINKILLELSQLLALMIIQSVITVIALSYYIFVLGIKYGGDTLLVYFTSVAANLLGLSLGYMVAHIGKMARDKKEGILMAILLGGGFMAGLMLGDIKIWVEKTFPLFNRINPSAVITDAFYALNVFGVGPRYYRSLIYIFGLSFVMTLIGLILSRKNSYKSL